eukprot:2674020-Pyramimonas_sp.AAC.1
MSAISGRFTPLANPLSRYSGRVEVLWQCVLSILVHTLMFARVSQYLDRPFIPFSYGLAYLVHRLVMPHTM